MVDLATSSGRGRTIGHRARPRPRRWWLLALLTAALSITACSTSPPDGEASGQTTVERGITTEETITVAGAERSYRLHRHEAIEEPVPLVIMLHGGFGSGRQAERAYGWNELADRDRFAVAYPDGMNRSWAVSDECCGPSGIGGVDDVAFISAVVEDISGEIAVDPDRIYAAGISNGGMLAYRLACDTTLFAAIGADSATMFGECPSPSPLSILHIHGAADQTVPLTGGLAANDRRPVELDGPAIEDLVTWWRTVADCGEPTGSTEGEVTTSSASCPEGRAVDLIIIEGAGHQWPGADGNSVLERLFGLDTPSTALDATETFWGFFADHPRQG